MSFMKKVFLAYMQSIFEYYRARHNVAQQSIFYYQMVAIKKNLAFGRYAWVGRCRNGCCRHGIPASHEHGSVSLMLAHCEMVFSTWRDVQSKKKML